MTDETPRSESDQQKVDVFDTPPEPPREAQLERKQTGCCEEAQADGVACTNPRNTCETCGKSVLDHPRHSCDAGADHS